MVEHPGTPALAEDSSCQPVEAAMWHTFLDCGVTDNVHPVTDLEFLNDTGNRRKPALS